MHSAEALWMSPDGHMMLYASFNDSLVEEMHISWFGEGNQVLYPDIRSLRYPKVCFPLPYIGINFHNKQLLLTSFHIFRLAK